jgi:hypothetical protein
VYHDEDEERLVELKVVGILGPYLVDAVDEQEKDWRQAPLLEFLGVGLAPFMPFFWGAGM